MTQLNFRWSIKLYISLSYCPHIQISQLGPTSLIRGINRGEGFLFITVSSWDLTTKTDKKIWGKLNYTGYKHCWAAVSPAPSEGTWYHCAVCTFLFNLWLSFLVYSVNIGERTCGWVLDQRPWKSCLFAPRDICRNVPFHELIFNHDQPAVLTLQIQFTKEMIIRWSRLRKWWIVMLRSITSCKTEGRCASQPHSSTQQNDHTDPVQRQASAAYTCSVCFCACGRWNVCACACWRLCLSLTLIIPLLEQSPLRSPFFLWPQTPFIRISRLLRPLLIGAAAFLLHSYVLLWQPTLLQGPVFV